MCAPGCFSILLFEFCSWLYNIWLSLPHMYLRLICRLLFCSPFSFTPFLLKKHMPYFFCFLAPDRWPRPTGHEQQTAVTSHVSPWLIFLWASGLFNLKIFRGHHLNGRVWVLSYDSSDYLVATTNQPSFIDPGLTASKMHPLSLSLWVWVNCINLAWLSLSQHAQNTRGGCQAALWRENMLYHVIDSRNKYDQKKNLKVS